MPVFSYKTLAVSGAFFVVLYGLVLLYGLQVTTPEVVYQRPPAQTGGAATATSSSPADSVPSSAVPEPVSSSPEAVPAASLPGSVLIDVPFTPQAPRGDWGYPYQEACEEASVIMVYAYFTQTELTQAEADRQIREIVSWQTDRGYRQDVGVVQLQKIVRDYYGYRSRILEDPTLEDLQRELAAGRPVILPVAGQELGNPYFNGDGPPYHMLVLIGYNRRDFITNDPGTRRGEHYRYSHDTILQAIHDWTGSKDTVRQGRRVGLVLEANDSPPF